MRGKYLVCEFSYGSVHSVKALNQQAKSYSLETSAEGRIEICGSIGWDGETTPLVLVGIIYMLSLNIQ